MRELGVIDIIAFLSTLSVRRATITLVYWYFHFAISIHALREESDRGTLNGDFTVTISIHALREESDAKIIKRQKPGIYFYPRSP